MTLAQQIRELMGRANIEGAFGVVQGRKHPMVFSAGDELRYVCYCADGPGFGEPTDNLASAELIALLLNNAETLAQAVEAISQIAELTKWHSLPLTYEIHQLCLSALPTPPTKEDQNDDAG